MEVEKETTEDGPTDLSNPNVVTKYREAATIADTALKGVLTMLVPGKSVVEICTFGDTIIEAAVRPSVLPTSMLQLRTQLHTLWRLSAPPSLPIFGG